MEALFIIVAELIAALFQPMIAILVVPLAAMASTLFESLLMLAAWILGRRRARPAPAEVPAQVPASTGHLRRWLLRIGAGCAALLLLAVVVLECGLDRWLVRRALDRLAVSGGLQVQAERIEVWTLAGQVALHGATVSVRTARVDAELTMHRAEIDASLWSLLGGSVGIESATCRGVRGRLRNVEPVDDGAAVATAPRPAPRRQVRIASLMLEDVLVDLDLSFGKRRVAGPLRVDSSYTTALSTRSLIGAILLRTTGTASWLGASVAIATREMPGGRATEWDVRGLPAEAMGIHLGRPWDMLAGGRVDLGLRDEWSLDGPDGRRIQSHLTLRGRSLVIDPPQDAGIFTAALAASASRALALTGGRIEIETRVRIDEDHLEFDASEHLRSLGDALIETLLDRFAADAAERAHLRQLGAKAATGIRNALDRWRRR